MLIRFDEYQERCLYDPDHGFFTRSGGAGRRGDFITSPEIGPLFGEVLANMARSLWEEMGRPADFQIIDVGAGRGALVASMRRAWLAASKATQVAPAVRWRVLEQSVVLRAAAAELFGPEVEVSAGLDDKPIVGLVIANELLDNLAVRIVERTGDGWSEVWVRIDDDGACEVLRPLDGDGDALVSALGLDSTVGVGTRVPIQHAASRWVHTTLDQISAGRLLVIDYGVATVADLADRTWLRTYRAHERGDDPYDSPMERDITVDIVVEQLKTPTRVGTQAERLRAWGIGDLVDEGKQIWAERAHLGDLAAMKARSRVSEAEALVDESGLGAFLVLEWDIDRRHS